MKLIVQLSRTPRGIVEAHVVQARFRGRNILAGRQLTKLEAAKRAIIDHFANIHWELDDIDFQVLGPGEDAKGAPSSGQPGQSAAQL